MIYVIIGAICYGVFQVLAGFAAAKMSDWWFLLIGNSTVLLFTLLIVGQHLTAGGSMGSFTRSGLVLATASSVFIAIYVLTLGRAFQTVPAGTVIPLLFGLAILLSTIASWVFAKHVPTGLEIVGLVLVSGGLLALGLGAK